MNGKKIKLFKLMGFEVGLDPSWIVLAILVAWSLSTGFFPFHYRNLSAQTYWIMGTIGAVGLFLSIIAHELSHSILARKRGVAMKGITLFIFGGVAEMNGEPLNAKDELMIAVAGPVTSFIVAALFYGLNQIGMAAGLSLSIVAVLAYLSAINLILGIFN